ncbi:MAG: hypothetical protein ACT4QE_19755 [Anaerolineales bacterium]
MPVGHNETLTGANLNGLMQHNNMRSVERYFRRLQQCGVTCLRLTLERCREPYFFLESPAGHFQPEVVCIWDDVFRLCERYGIRLLLSVYDVVGMWQQWDSHPYNRANGGPCASPAETLICPHARAAIKARLAFATERWGRSGALFAWELWSALQPADRSDCAQVQPDFIADLSSHLRELELNLHGRAHLQTASVLASPREQSHPDLLGFDLPMLDFVGLHMHDDVTEETVFDNIRAAMSMGRLVRDALAHLPAGRPLIVSQAHPISINDEGYRYRAWAHLSSGGAGGGLNWLIGDEHCLTPAVHAAQSALAGFFSLVYWPQFQRRNLTEQLALSKESFRGFACGDEAQAILWLVCTDQVGQSRPGSGQIVDVRVPGLGPGHYRVTAWHTREGRMYDSRLATCVSGEGLEFRTPPIATDLAFAIRKLPDGLKR